jgi:hypothetical protein
VQHGGPIDAGLNPEERLAALSRDGVHVAETWETIPSRDTNEFTLNKRVFVLCRLSNQD